MYKLCKTEQSAKRQKEIEHALLSLMNEIPYSQISITELCEKIDIPRKAFYRYFDSKEDALQGLLEHTITDYYTANTPNIGAPRSLERELCQFFVFWREKQEFLDALEANNLTGLLIDACVNFPVHNLIKLERFFPNDPQTLRHAIFRFAVVGLIFHMLEWYRSGYAHTVEDMARFSIRMLCSPIFPSLSQLGFNEDEIKKILNNENNC